MLRVACAAALPGCALAAAARLARLLLRSGTRRPTQDRILLSQGVVKKTKDKYASKIAANQAAAKTKREKKKWQKPAKQQTGKFQ